MAFTAAQIPGIAGRTYPASLAGPFYPNGIPIYEESELPRLIVEKNVRLVVFSYSDLTHEEVMHKASLVLSLGADFMFLGPQSTMLKSSKKVVAVTATKTGAGKSTISRYIVRLLRDAGVKTVVIRHPMPYGVLEKQVVQRFEDVEDLDRNNCTVEEREEIEPHLRNGTIVYTGVDYEAVLKEAEKEAEIIVWDGGNNDIPFIKPDLHVTVVDAFRPGLETNTYPGEANLLMADVIVVNKADKASAEDLSNLLNKLHSINPRALIVRTMSRISVERGWELKGLRACVVEDGPSLTHGGMSVGAAYEAAVNSGAVIVDPRDYAVGTIRRAYMEYPHIGPVVPTIGYNPEQLNDLEKTLEAVECDVVVSSSQADLSKIIKINKPVYSVRFEAVEMDGSVLARALHSFGLLR